LANPLQPIGIVAPSLRVGNDAWAKREMQIQAVVESTSGMYGDLRGIAGQAIGSIDALEIETAHLGTADGEAKPDRQKLD
jgi:hypothetical protein